MTTTVVSVKAFGFFDGPSGHATWENRVVETEIRDGRYGKFGRIENGCSLEGTLQNALNSLANRVSLTGGVSIVFIPGVLRKNPLATSAIEREEALPKLVYQYHPDTGIDDHEVRLSFATTKTEAFRGEINKILWRNGMPEIPFLEEKFRSRSRLRSARIDHAPVWL